MRTIFKNKNYFKEYIEELQSILEGNKNKVLDDEMKNKRMKVRNCLYKEQILIASYSLGTSINQIEILYSDAVNEICKNWVAEIVKFRMGEKVLNQLYVYHHDSILRLISIGVLLDANKELQNLKNKLSELKITNRLFDKLINSKIPEHEITPEVNSYCPTAFNKLEKLVFEHPIEEKKLNTYHKTWYATLNKNYFQWKDTHLNRGKGFHGYWDFTIAALAKINSFKSKKLQSSIFFPTDLFLKDGRKYDYILSEHLKLLISIDELISKMGGIRRTTNEILALRKDLFKGRKPKHESLIEKVNGYMNWIKQNYTHEVSIQELNPYFENIERNLITVNE